VVVQEHLLLPHHEDRDREVPTRLLRTHRAPGYTSRSTGYAGSQIDKTNLRKLRLVVRLERRSGQVARIPEDAFRRADEAAVREVFEETGIRVELVGERREDIEDPVQLNRPAGVQLENIGPNHQHIDLIYFAKPSGPTKIHQEFTADKVGWYGPDDWDGMSVNAEVRGWCERALSALAGYGSEQSRR
jgi:8-oxo-dGTP pyrophosphatase MutT (NUDIX family)